MWYVTCSSYDLNVFEAGFIFTLYFHSVGSTVSSYNYSWLEVRLSFMYPEPVVLKL